MLESHLHCPLQLPWLLRFYYLFYFTEVLGRRKSRLLSILFLSGCNIAQVYYEEKFKPSRKLKKGQKTPWNPATWRHLLEPTSLSSPRGTSRNAQDFACTFLSESSLPGEPRSQRWGPIVKGEYCSTSRWAALRFTPNCPLLFCFLLLTFHLMVDTWSLLSLGWSVGKQIIRYFALWNSR